VPEERHRAQRYAFSATVELTHVTTGAEVRERTADLSVFGCLVKTAKPWPVGTKVRIRIVHGGASFVALGTVAYENANGGMGLAFGKIEPNQQLILDRWIADLRRH
jgi:hypothetical protein